MWNFWKFGEEGNNNREHELHYEYGRFYLDMSDGEYGFMEITHCPFCGARLEVEKRAKKRD